MMYTLLWIEDDPNDILLGERALHKSGFPKPIVLRDGEEAIAYLSGKGPYEDRSRHPLPSLILSDLKLPRVSGFDIVRWLRDQKGLRRIPFIFFTSSRQRRDIDLAYDCGANAYLVKPVESHVLVDLFRSLCSFWMSYNASPDLSMNPLVR
ncbi:MAG TPA: response regulator [Planctomycetota bacterium]|nr:response regulator [Planctomycetota bacterium]